MARFPSYRSTFLVACCSVAVGAPGGFKVQEKEVTLRMNVENLTDKHYWASANGGYLTQGDPRLVKFSGTIDL